MLIDKLRFLAGQRLIELAQAGEDVGRVVAHGGPQDAIGEGGADA